VSNWQPPYFDRIGQAYDAAYDAVASGHRLADYKAQGLDQTGEIVECWCGWRGPKGLAHCNRCTLEKGPMEGRGRHHGPDYQHKGDCKRCHVREAVRYDRRHRVDPKGTEHGQYCQQCLIEMGVAE